MAAAWSLWTHRNDMIFNGEEVNMESVLDLIKIRSWQ